MNERRTSDKMNEPHTQSYILFLLQSTLDLCRPYCRPYEITDCVPLERVGRWARMENSR